MIGLAPSSGNDFIKRVIGVGGDTIRCRDDVLSVNGHRLNEPFLYPGSHPCSADGFEGKTVRVPKGDVFVMGDHRDDSEDSRVNGAVPVSDVIGRAFVVIWPLSQLEDAADSGDLQAARPGRAGVAYHRGRCSACWSSWSCWPSLAVAVVRRRRGRPATYAAGDG